MKTLLPLLLALFSLSLPLNDALAQTDQQPPTAVIYTDVFSALSPHLWEEESGTWTPVDGAFASIAAGAADISVITSYRGISPADPRQDEMRFPEFIVRAVMRNAGTTDEHLVGLVYGYQDSQNYNEAVVSALGTVQIRTVIDGAVASSSPAVHRPVPRSTWFALEVRVKNGVTTAKVNGVNAGSFSQTEFTTGKVGLVTHGTLGRFDHVFLGVPFGSQDFLETFHQAPFVTFTPVSGQWSVVNGVYRDSATEQTNITLAPIDTGNFKTFEYTFRARMLNPSGGSANLMGIVFNYRTSDYTELVFSPTGVARLSRFENGALHTVATATVGTQRNQAFEVSLENGPNDFTVTVDGQRIFQDVDVFSVNPDQFPSGRVGLITHFSPGRFDNVEFNNSIFRPCSLTFDPPDPVLPQMIRSGTWDQTGGTLNSIAVGRADIVALSLRCRGIKLGDERVDDNRETSFIYRARLFNQYGAPGNLVGVVYNYQDAFNYYEIVFSSTGVMQMNRIVEGVRTRVRSATQKIPQKTWFGVQVFRQGVRTTVKVGGVPVVADQLQGELLGGSVGVITRSSKGSFDSVSMIPLVQHPSSEL